MLVRSRSLRTHPHSVTSRTSYDGLVIVVGIAPSRWNDGWVLADVERTVDSIDRKKLALFAEASIRDISIGGHDSRHDGRKGRQSGEKLHDAFHGELREMKCTY